MCLRIYLAADRPLEPFSSGHLRLEPLQEQRWNRGLLSQPYRYDLGPACACDLLSDGLTPEEQAGRQALLADVATYVAKISSRGPIGALVCWAGDEKKQSTVAEVTPAQFRDFDFDSAFDQPWRLTIVPSPAD